MKRLGLSILISLCFGTGYLVATVLLLAFVFPASDRAAELLAIPFRLPFIVYDYFFTLPDSDNPLFYPFFVVGFVIDMVMYTVPIYWVLTILAKRKRVSAFSTDPPPPPSLDD